MNNIYSALMPHLANSVERNTTGKLPSANGGFDDLLTSINKREAEKNKPANSNGDGLAKFVQQVVISMDDSLANIFANVGDDKKDKFSISSLDQASTIYGVDSVFSTTDSSAIFDFNYDSFVNGAGPLPAYLKMLDKSLNLTTEQSQKLRDIAWDNRNIVKSPESVKALGAQLREAGIG